MNSKIVRTAHILIATPESDAKYRKEYSERGYADAKDGKPRMVKQGGLVTKWYNEGYDAFLKTLEG